MREGWGSRGTRPCRGRNQQLRCEQPWRNLLLPDVPEAVGNAVGRTKVVQVAVCTEAEPGRELSMHWPFSLSAALLVHLIVFCQETHCSLLLPTLAWLQTTVAAPSCCAGRESAVTLPIFNVCFLSFFPLLVLAVAFLGGWVQMDLCDTDSDEEILERILELPLQKNHSKKLFSIPEVTEDEDEEEDERCVTEEKADPQDSSGALTCPSGRTEKPLSTKEPFVKAGGSNTSMDLSPQSPREERGDKESRGDGNHANPAFVQPAWSQKKANWNWGYQENDPKSGTGASPTRSKKKGNNYREKVRNRPEMGRKRQNDLTEHCSRLQGNCGQMGGGLYRAPSLREELNIVSSAGGKEGFDMYSRARQGALRKNHKKVVSGFAEPAVRATRCSSPRSLEIDIEYDSEDDQDSSCASPPESGLWPERSQGCQGDWSDCSSQPEVAHTGDRRDLTRLEMVEEQRMEWAGSPSQRLRFFCREKEALRCESSSEEQGWELDCKSPGWRKRLEHPSKGIHSTSLHKRVG